MFDKVLKPHSSDVGYDRNVCCDEVSVVNERRSP